MNLLLDTLKNGRRKIKKRKDTTEKTPAVGCVAWECLFYLIRATLCAAGWVRGTD